MLCPHQITLKSGDVVPCGRCPTCRANERQEWVFRLKQEAKVSFFSLFVTLTYDDAHIPDGFNVNKRDVQLFLKRFRKQLKSKDLRYYIVSEYGDHTQRPHYHGLFFFQSPVNDERKLYDKITDAWQNGFCKFGKVEEGSIVYCTKYCLKKSSVPPGHEKVFRLMSKMNGGLGFSYIDNMGVFHVDSSNYSVAFDNGKRCRMPRYYKDLFRKNNPVYEQVKESSQNRFYNTLSAQAQSDFAAFIKNNHFDDLAAACDAYNLAQKHKNERREELILKHCKKQVF